MAPSSSVADRFAARKAKSAALRDGYSSGKRLAETLSIVAFCVTLVLSLKVFWQLCRLENAPLMVLGMLLGMLAADNVSGIAHWAADTWGTVEFPVVGQTFIRAFREHHLDPAAICTHDFIQTNGDNFMLGAIPLLAPAYAALVLPQEHAEQNVFQVLFLVMFSVYVAYTNQIHKWAHERNPPAIVAALQSLNIILSRKEHNIHHHTPFDRSYCITTSWLNHPLMALGVWKRVEHAISWATGAVPRRDDALWTLQDPDPRQANDADGDGDSDSSSSDSDDEGSVDHAPASPTIRRRVRA